MNGEPMSEPVTVMLEGHTLTLSGTLERDTIAGLNLALARLSPPGGAIAVELDAFEIADGLAAVAMVNLIRHIAATRHVTLCNAPQLLGHNLYRVGALAAGGMIELRALRDEEPYG